MKKTILGIATLALVTNVALAAFPEKPITLVVPFPPGGSSDTIARAISVEMQKRLGQSVIVDNRGGASGTIGATLVKRPQ